LTPPGTLRAFPGSGPGLHVGTESRHALLAVKGP
jgi:hypothetical protein